MTELFYTTRESIDINAWDNCVSNSKNTVIYAFSAYLDAMCESKWDAIISMDYSVVFPLPWRKKFGIKYIYQPAFIQQLGLFSPEIITQDIILKSHILLKQHTRFAEYTFNAGNDLSFLGNQVHCRNNYLVPLNKHYDEIKESYKNSFNKNLQRLLKWDLTYKKNEDVPAVINLYKKLYGGRFPSVKKKDYANFERLCLQLQKHDHLFIRQVFAEDELLGTVLLLVDENRYYSIVSCITENGKKKRANYFLYDSIIKEFCEQEKFLDLEGSDISGVADFFKTMNPILESYSFLRYNNLLPIVKLFKP